MLYPLFRTKDVKEKGGKKDAEDDIGIRRQAVKEP